MQVLIRRELERPLEQRVVRWATARGVPALKLTPTGTSAWPDRIFLLPGGRPLLIEFKRQGEVPRPLQLQRHAELRALGYDVNVHDTFDGAIEALRARMS